MVQDRLEATAGVPFVHPFFTAQVFPRDREIRLVPVDDFTMSMTLTTAEGTDFEFTFGQGLTEGKQPDGTAAVIFAIHEPADLGLGDHTFHVTAEGPDGVVLDETGTLTVVANPDGATVSPGKPTWFDAINPTSPELGSGGELPAPEIPTAIRDERLVICNGCPALNKDTAECTECGCYMPIKSGLISAECPLGKWGKYV